MNSRELYINDILCDLPESTPVAITFQINNLADIQDRQSTYTNAIKLPKTPNNCRALGYANIDAFTQDEPYKNNPCKYVESGVEIIPLGIAILQSVTDFFDVQLIYGVVGLNDIFDDKNIQTLDFSEYNYPYSLEGIIASQQATEGYLWPVIDFGNLDNSSVIETKYLRPAFFTRTIINKLANYAGYTFAGSILNDKYFKSELITALQNEAPEIVTGENLPDMLVKDFLKDVMQRYFLTPEVDNYTKTLRFRSFDELYQNIPNAKDWTGKFIDDARSDTFALPGYAQENKLAYKDIDGLLFFDSGNAINVNNKTLDNSKTIVTSKFSPTNNITPRLGSLTIAFADIKATDDNSGKTATTNSRVLYNRLTTGFGLYEFKLGVFSDLSEKISIPYFYGADLEGLKWGELINRYGTGLVNMLAKSRVVTRYVVLDAFDVYNFDYFTPVFDKVDGVYYYVNQIVNWQPNKKVKVNLIRL